LTAPTVAAENPDSPNGADEDVTVDANAAINTAKKEIEVTHE
jgi:hypothetical protein